jgi:hypothetical protein
LETALGQKFKSSKEKFSHFRAFIGWKKKLSK